MPTPRKGLICFVFRLLFFEGSREKLEGHEIKIKNRTDSHQNNSKWICMIYLALAEYMQLLSQYTDYIENMSLRQDNQIIE